MGEWKVSKKYLQVEMPDGSKWAVPVLVIAYHRACYYAERDGVSIEENLNRDTLPLFYSSPDEVEDWAENNMNWCDIQQTALQVRPPVAEVDYQEGWVNGEKELIEI